MLKFQSLWRSTRNTSASCLQEEIWEQIQAHRTRIRAANQPYAENRSFSNTVRELVKKGKLEEARQLCLKQVRLFFCRLWTGKERAFQLQPAEGMIVYKRALCSKLPFLEHNLKRQGRGIVWQPKHVCCRVFFKFVAADLKSF